MKQVTLTKLFSRERTFFYLCLWNDTDRMGYKNFAKHAIKNSMFMFDKHNKGTVWYNVEAQEVANKKLAEVLNKHPEVFEQMAALLQKEWKYLFPFLSHKRDLKSIDQFSEYYRHLVTWWSAMTLWFYIPSIAGVSKSFVKRSLQYRRETQDYSDDMYKLYIEFWHKNFPKYNDLTFVLSPHEAVELGKGQMSTRQISEIRKRFEGFAMLNEKIYLLADLPKALKKQHLVLEQESTKRVKEIKGMVACKGLVSGRVRKILYRAQLPTLKNGEILVTEMTDPDYVQAMKKAAAIITDEGGMVCHAAIVARELGKPCIVGTKIATQVLKDGDMVEVDANKGIVKILK